MVVECFFVASPLHAFRDFLIEMRHGGSGVLVRMGMSGSDDALVELRTLLIEPADHPYARSNSQYAADNDDENSREELLPHHVMSMLIKLSPDHVMSLLMRVTDILQMAGPLALNS